jgi:phage gp36-like protein
MSYCTQDDLLEQISEAELIELTDDAGSGEVDADVVTRAIADADATIDAHCQGRYSVPLSPVPAMIRAVSVDMAIYNLLSRKNEEVPKSRDDRNRNAIRFLERVADGKIQLGASTPAQANTEHSVSIDSGSRIFTRDKMRGY